MAAALEMISTTTMSLTHERRRFWKSDVEDILFPSLDAMGFGAIISNVPIYTLALPLVESAAGEGWLPVRSMGRRRDYIHLIWLQSAAFAGMPETALTI
jgi:hypothetical protein